MGLLNDKDLDEYLALIGAYFAMELGDNPEDDFAKGIYKRFNAVREHLYTLMENNGWVSVKDELPNEKINPNTHDLEYVLCYTTFGDVRAYKYGTPMLNKLPHFWGGGGSVDEYVTHWQYMPEPPKEVSE